MLWLPTATAWKLFSSFCGWIRRGRKTKEAAPGVIEHDAAHHGASSENVLGQADVEFEIAQYPGRDDPGYKNRREHGRDHDVEKIVAGVQGSNADHESDENVDDASAGNVVIERLAQPLDSDSARQVGHGDQTDQRGQNQRCGCQNKRRPEISGVAGYRGEQCCGKG